MYRALTIILKGEAKNVSVFQISTRQGHKCLVNRCNLELQLQLYTAKSQY